MDVTRPPFLPLNFFWKQYSSAQRSLFVFLMAACIFAAGFFLFAYQNPTFWSLDMQEATAYTATEVPVTTITENYREYPLQLEAWEGVTSYVSGPLLPKATPVLLFTLLQLLMWGAFLTAMSYVKSNWIFGGLFLFAIHTHLTKATLMLIEGPWGYAAELGVLILFLGVPYAFTAGWIRASLWVRFLSIVVMIGLLWGAVMYQFGWQGAHALAANSYPSLIFWAGFATFFIAMGPINVIIAAATNRRQKIARFSYGLTFTLMIVWLLCALFLLNDYLQFSFLLKGLGSIKPAYILIPIALATPFLAQNHFHFVRKILGENIVYTLVLLAAVLFVLSHGALQSALGDTSGMYGFDRLAAGAFLFVGIGQFSYIITNHRQLLYNRVNIYFLMPFGPVVRFMFVWMLAFAGWIIVESLGVWSGSNMALHSYQLRLADQNVLEGKTDNAVNRYRYASNKVLNSTKAHYNLGSILMVPSAVPGSYNDHAQEALEAFNKIPRFPLAGLAKSNLWSLTNRQDRARSVLRQQYEITPDAYVAANLSASFMGDSLPDSVIVWGKKALLLDGNLSAVCANLGLLYDNEGYTETAQEFYEASLQTTDIAPVARVNNIAFALRHQKPITKSTIIPDSLGSLEWQYNYLLSKLALSEGNELELAAQARKLADSYPGVNTYILDSWLRFEQGKYEEAISRLDYARSQFSKQDNGRTTQLTALAYLREGVPEMALPYFEDAYQAGNVQAGLYRAFLELDLGLADSAQRHLSLMRVYHPELWQQASKELSLLLLSQGEPVFAATEYDPSKLKAFDWIKAGQYADSVRQYIPALENFRRAITLDSSLAAPYIEMANIYNRYDDPAGIENAQYGLNEFPDSRPLRESLAMAYLKNKNLDAAAAQLDSIKNPGKVSRLLRAKLTVAQGDTATGQAMLETLVADQSLYQDAVLELASVYFSQNKLDEGQALIADALDLNNRNAEIWYNYARYFQAWSQEEDTGYGALKAIELSPSPERKQALQKQFAEEIKAVIK
ncbi:MAG: hypothetical protein AB8F95_09750 [Bacteroidia bacterium]